MWVRNQDKTLLIKCNNFSVECYTNSKTNMNSFDIETIETPNGKFTTLGSYSSKEKALKVLDMIQEHIKNMYIGTGGYMGKPFQMPQDSEVE
jgi:hypothetical protein